MPNHPQHFQQLSLSLSFSLSSLSLCLRQEPSLIPYDPALPLECFLPGAPSHTLGIQDLACMTQFSISLFIPGQVSVCLWVKWRNNSYSVVLPGSHNLTSPLSTVQTVLAINSVTASCSPPESCNSPRVCPPPSPTLLSASRLPVCIPLFHLTHSLWGLASTGNSHRFSQFHVPELDSLHVDSGHEDKTSPGQRPRQSICTFSF